MSEALPRGGRIVDSAFLYPVRVYYEDTDAAGVVYHANYLKFAERARTEMLRCLGISQERLRIDDGGVVLVIRHCTVDFRATAHLDDDLIVATRLVSAAGASLDLAQEIRRDDSVLVHLDSKIACVGRDGRPTRFPPPLKAVLSSFNA